MTNIMDKNLQKIEKIMDINPKKFEEIKKISENIIENSEKIKKVIKNPKTEKKVRKKLKKIKKHHKKFSNDLESSKSSKISKEWKKIALQDFFYLKNEIMVLQELLTSHEKEIRKNILTNQIGFDPLELLDKIQSSEVVSKRAREKLSIYLKNSSDQEKRKKIIENKKILKNLNKWLKIKKEVEKNLD